MRAERPAADRFVGRKREAADLVARLSTSAVVTIAGPPGVGKSRLASEVVELIEGDVVLVDLAAVERPDGVGRALGAALGLLESAQVPREDALVTALRHRPPLLMVFDNCEHLLPACGEVIRLVTRSNADVRVLATTREPTGIECESVLHLDPLAVPPEGLTRTDDVARYEAVDLFVERARALRPDFSMTRQNVQAVAAVCRRLDGIPLAIEVAAARADVVSPTQLASLITTRFSSLASTAHPGRSSHGSLDAAVAWSYELLSTSEKLLLRRLSVFAGGASVAAAEAVCADPGVPADHVRSVLRALKARSLVVEDRRATECRYRLLQVVRHFAAGRLVAAGEQAETCDRHADWALSLAERAEPEIVGPSQREWLRRLDEEADNFRAAFDWLISQGQAERALLLGSALTLWWRARGRFVEGHQQLMAAVRMGLEVSPAVLARGFWAAGYLAHMCGDADADALLERSLQAAWVVRDQAIVARALLVQAGGQELAHMADGLSLLERASELARAHNDHWCLAHALAVRAWIVEAFIGDAHQARRLLEESVAVARRAGDTLSLLYTLNELSLFLLRQGPSEAEDPVREALSLSAEHPYEQANALFNLGRLDFERGNYEAARRPLEEALASLRLLGSPMPTPDVAIVLAWLAQATGDLTEARRRLDEAASALGQRELRSAAVSIGFAQVAGGRRHPTTAWRFAATAVEDARLTRHRSSTARALLCVAAVARGTGDIATAVASAREATTLLSGADEHRLSIDCIETIGGLAASRGRHRDAARLFGCADAARGRHRVARFVPDVPYYDMDVDSTGKSLGEVEFRSLWSEGARLGEDDIERLVDDVLASLSIADRWPDLTTAESTVADLVAEGLTNHQIGERLGISPHTVRGHISEIFRRLSVPSRTAVGREAVEASDSTDFHGAIAEPLAPTLPLDEFLRLFPDDDACLLWLWRQRYSPDGVHAHCPACGVQRSFHYYRSRGDKRRWTCDRCNLHIRPTADTVFHASSTPIRAWFYAAYLLVATDCTLPARQLQREIGVGYKTAWRMLDLVRRQLITASPTE